MELTIGSRGSKLALWQAEWAKAQLVRVGCAVEIKIIKTTGDKLSNILLTRSGTKGLFIKEIEEALLDGSVDLAVHSLKDLPTEQPSGLHVCAVPEREDPRDVLVSRNGQTWKELSPGSRVGTGSLRREAQLRSLRSDVEVVPMRGNVDTRLGKLDRGDCEALVLAAAGLHRLGLRERIAEYFAAEQVCSAVGQGAMAIETRVGDAKVERAVKPLDRAPAHQAVRAERVMLRCLGGGCQVPIAAHAAVHGTELKLVGVVASLDGARILRASGNGSVGNPEALGEQIAEDLLRQGAKSILGS